MWGIVGILVGLAVAAMSVAAPFVFHRLQFIAVPVFILGAVVAVAAIGFGFWWEFGKQFVALPLFIFADAVAAGAIGFGIWWAIGNQKKPEFRLNILSAYVFTCDHPTKPTGIVLDAEIWNMGGRSRVMDWSLAVIPKGRVPEVGKVRAISKQLTLSGHTHVVYGADDLNRKTSARNIPKDPLTGPLLFQFSLEKQTITDDSTTFVLTAADLYGTPFSYQTTVGEL